jgi:Undecaprenyl-phosphate galactose phosphotransferase WbaP
MDKPFTPQFQVFTPSVRHGVLVHNRRTLMSLTLIFSDMLAYFAALSLAILLRFTLIGEPIPSYYSNYAVLIPFALLVNLSSGLYNHNTSEVEELQQLCKSTTITFLIATAIFFLIKEGIVSRVVILLAWVFSIAIAPTLRELVRSIFVHTGKWGEPVVIFGNGRLGREVAAYLQAHPKMGYNPVGVVDQRKVERDPTVAGKVIYDDTIFTNGTPIPDWFKGVRTAFVVTPETSNSIHSMLINKNTIRFEQLIMVRSAEKTGSVWVQPLDIGGILGLVVNQNLLNRSQLLVKRIMDLTLITFSIPIFIPLFGIVALLIKLDSPGRIFYHQIRIGFGGKTFKFWKFRSMYEGAEQRLSEYLAANPDRKTEYEINHKLKYDPRVTRVGKFIRKFSIDELPQLINVLNGEMSLVGPRPFMPDEIGLYDQCYSLYTYVQPGVTGLWQISGRSNVSYSTRVNLDDYYLRNWSIWLDIHILIRTIMVVLQGRGSY